MNSIGIAAVERSDSDKFKEGSLVMNYAMDWQEYYVVPADALGSLVPIQKNDKIPLSVYLSALGMPGRTSFTSFYDIGASSAPFRADTRRQAQEGRVDLRDRGQRCRRTARRPAGQARVRVGRLRRLLIDKGPPRHRNGRLG